MWMNLKLVCKTIQTEAGEHMFDKMRRLPDAELEVEGNLGQHTTNVDQ